MMSSFFERRNNRTLVGETVRPHYGAHDRTTVPQGPLGH